MKKKYWLYGLLIFVIAVIGYHYYAASQAEEQINRLIQQQAEHQQNFSVQYSNLNISPFSANADFSDLTIINGNHIQRSKELTLDLSYLDFLKFYFGSAKYALENLKTAEVILVKPSYLNKENLNEIKANSLQLYFDGQLLDVIQSVVLDKPFGRDQQIQLSGNGLNMQLPQNLVNSLKAEDFSYSGSIDAGGNDFLKQGAQQISLDSLTLTPSNSFQQNYNFFIRGFGYQANAIPLKSATFRSSPVSNSKLVDIQAKIKSELALFKVNSNVMPRQNWNTSPIQDAQLNITHLSPAFREVVKKVEQLFSISLLKGDNGITIPISGTVGNPQIKWSSEQ